jgi:hypothetical protein
MGKLQCQKHMKGTSPNTDSNFTLLMIKAYIQFDFSSFTCL